MTVPVSFVGSWLKYERAMEHLNSLYLEADEYMQRVQWSVVVANPTEGVIEQEYRADPLPPDRLRLIVGDLAHNLRSALDVAAWELAIDNDERAALGSFRRVQFPLTSDQAEFRKHKALPFFSQRARSALEAHQPYKDGNLALGWLQSLSNADKHQVTTFSFAAMAEIPGDQTGVQGFSPQLRLGSAFGHVGVTGIRAMAATVAAVLQDLEDKFGEQKRDPLIGLGQGLETQDGDSAAGPHIQMTNTITPCCSDGPTQTLGS